jgi:hypothetical protein
VPDCGAASVSHDTKLDAGRNVRKPTKTGMFYDPLLATGLYSSSLKYFSKVLIVKIDFTKISSMTLI